MNSQRRGSSLFILFGVISVLFIFGASFLYMTSQQGTLIQITEARLRSRYLAESVATKLLYKIQSEFQREFIYMEKDKNGEPVFEINNKLYDLINIQRIEDYARGFSLDSDELMKGGEASATIEVVDVKSNPFSTFIDYQEQIPENLKIHQKPRNATSTMELEALGGFFARMKVKSCGKWAGNKECFEFVKSLSVSDITPPAPDHTLFIHSQKPELLKHGTFHLSNLTLPPVIVKLLYRLSQQVKDTLGLELNEDREKTMEIIDQLNKAFTENFQSESTENAVKMVQQLSKEITDDTISETVDNIILSLSPRNWGRVRTNGRLEVYMPFFAADDIINYFAEEGSWRELPEVGYLFHDNRLHDPYMSVYTHYEGLIYKKYRKIYPSQFGILEPEDSPPEQYTINTRLEYPTRYKDKYDVENLQRIRDFGLEVANRIFDERVILKGTDSLPISLEGIWYFRGGLEIGGKFSGRGLLISEKPIWVRDDLLKSDPSDSLALVSLWDEILLTKPEMILHSALYAHQGLKKNGCDSVFVLGNLAVEQLNREQMPSSFRCRFDYHFKNHMVDNIYGFFSKHHLYRRRINNSLHEDTFSIMSALPAL